MAAPEFASSRAPNVAALPRMRGFFPLQVMGELGLNNGDVWWMDATVVLFWCSELLVLNVDIRGRIDLRDGRTVELWVRTVPHEEPVRHANGYLHLAVWRAADAAGARSVDARLREYNPDAFRVDYTSPRLPERVAEVGGAPREQTEGEVLAARHAASLGELAADEHTIRSKRWRDWTVALAVGVVLGSLIGSVVADAGVARLVAFRHDPAAAVRYGLLRGGNFAGEPLDAADLSGADLRDSRLVGASFVGAKLVGAHLNLADVRRADFTNADLSTASFEGAKLADAVFRGADVRGTELTSDIGGADFLGAIYSGETRWQGGQPAAGAVGPGARIEQTRFANLVAVGVDLALLHARGARFTDANLQGSNLSGADLSHSVLLRTNLAGASLAGSSMVEAKCSECSFRDTNLDGFVATAADFTQADFSKSKGSKPEFRAVNFKSANLSGILWQQADLRKANLKAVNFAGAALNGCWLLGADMSFAIIVGAQMTDCVSDEFTIWPAGASPWIFGALEVAAGGDARGATLPLAAELSHRTLDRLRGSRMTAIEAIWSGSSLQGADFTSAALTGSAFDGCNLNGAIFAGTDLANARFTGASLKGASFTQAKVCGADFSSADLSGAKFDRAVACGATRWPNNRPPKGIILK